MAIHPALYPQALTSPVGAGPVSCGHTSTVRRDLWAVFNNQAAAAYLDKPTAGLFTENRFLINEMNRVAMGTALPVKSVVLLFTLDHFGGSTFAQMKAGMGCAMQLGDHFSAGIQLDYLLMSISEGYGTYHSISFEGGLLGQLTDKLSMGIHLFNPIQAKWTNTKESIPSHLRLGLGFNPEPSLRLFLEVDKSTGIPAVFCSGAEYCIRKRLFFRAGITTGIVRYTLGAGVRLKNLLIDVSSSVHSWLGYSPQISLTYSFKK